MTKADFVYMGTMSFDPLSLSLNRRLEIEKMRYKKGILPQITELKKEWSENKRKTQKGRKDDFKFLLKSKSESRHFSCKYENGEVYPKDIPVPDIKFIQYAEPHVLITDLYDKKKDWYGLHEMIKDFAMEAYISYELGLWLASISSAINCCEYILKYELFRHLNSNNKAKLRVAGKDRKLTLGRLKDNAYECLDLLNIRLFSDRLDYLNSVRISIYHFNPEKAEKVSQKGVLEVEKLGSITDETVIPIIAFRVYSVMIDLINHFYNKERALEYFQECISDWMKKRGISERDMKQ